jgi:putative tryptophan/tyrosine transport system ATP-binding protein
MLTLRNVTKVFSTDAGERITALDNIDLEVPSAQFLVIVGTNGSGKSTLMNVIAGAEQNDAGSIFLDNRDITGHAEYLRAALIGRVFQDPMRGTIPALTVVENLALAASRTAPRGLRSAVGKHFRDECHAKLSALGIGLESRMHQRVSTMSGGQRQVLSLLMATWHRPALLMLDEHTAALDPKSADLVLKMTQGIISREKVTAIMVTHSMQQAARLGDRLIVMHRGTIVRDISGTEKRLLRSTELFEEFETLRSSDLIDESVSVLLRKQYI